jgi:hypothetical protein
MRHVPAVDGRRQTGLRSLHSELRAVKLLRNPAFPYNTHLEYPTFGLFQQGWEPLT